MTQYPRRYTVVFRHKFKTTLANNFSLEDTRNPSYFLGMELRSLISNVTPNCDPSFYHDSHIRRCTFEEKKKINITLKNI